MKKVFTMDTLVASLYGAVGYGAGYFVPAANGVGVLPSILICTVAGAVLDKAGDRLVYNRSVQKSTGKKYVVYAGSAVFFLAAYYVMEKYYAHSLFSDLGTQLFFLAGIPVLAFVVSLGIRYLKRIRLVKKYGTGESGFVFDQEAEEYMKTLNGENRELSGYTGKDPVVRTGNGSYIGKKTKSGVSFLGIPYASAERWKKPVPVGASEKFYEAYYFGASEIQPESGHNILTHSRQDEECLSLNIWTAELDPEGKKPVLVWFHGGDGRYGGSAHPLYSLENIARAIPDAVFVNFNYRFGLFGVADFSAAGCPDSDEYRESTALSILDQIEALRWIRENIAAFGGDPENITAAGDTAGGNCICLLAAMKEAKGLFRRALVLCTSSQNTPGDDDAASLLGKKLLEEFRAERVSGLRTVTGGELREFTMQNYSLCETPPTDGRLVPSDIDSEYRNGAASGIEFIFGFASDDLSSWQGMLKGEVSLHDLMETYCGKIKEEIGPEKARRLDEILENYKETGLNPSDAKLRMMADMLFKSCVLHDVSTLSACGCRVRCFCWDVSGDIKEMTSNCVSMITTVLGNQEIAEQMGYLNDSGLTEIMQAFVGKFMHGQPLEIYNNEIKGVSEIVWDEFDEENKRVLYIEKDAITMTQNAFSENVRELEQLIS